LPEQKISKTPSFPKKRSQAAVAHTCNPSYSGERDENHDLKPFRANSSREPISKRPITKIELVEWLKV
jgi:hypothetical protein